ncbi:MAG: threonyl-tRNA synthetase [Gammaproteobacteria bacterium]|jgi:threonyl-tRNA synthetase
MPNLTLPDGSERSFDAPITGLEFASTIGKRLAKDAVAIRIDGELKDLSEPITVDAQVAIVTRTDDEGLELLRHDAAHVLAEAVKELYPDTQVTIGPSIANGFYYDFARPDPFTPEDLEVIETRMRDIVSRDETITRELWERDDAVAFFKSIGEDYKAEIIEGISSDEPLSLYRQGEFLDLCRGPHLPSTGRLGTAFKLTTVAGAYWRGDSRNAMLQRVYGTAWADDKSLKAYLRRLEEAERRDHRRLGKQMDLFHFQEESPGAVFWHPKGWTLFQQLINYMRTRQEDGGYQEINTPDIMDRSLWEASGHWETFGDHMYTTQTDEDRVFALKPMNCPGCVQVFRQGIKSYKELPLRLSEFGKVHRFEPSGALHGLLRVRAFTQDDAHIYCTADQITDECQRVCDLILSIYRDFGFEDVRIKFADRPETRVGSDEIWDRAEEALKTAMEATGLEYSVNPGEGAFYGPKLEFVLRDAIGRDWQCGTLQVDFNLPDRLGAAYTGDDGNRHIPVMLHRALFGSLERFTGILLEHYAGNLPLWLAPLQVMVATVVSDGDEYAANALKQLKAAGMRAEMDLRNETISYKVRQHSVEKVPVIFVIGKREAEEGTVTIRRLGTKRQQSLPLGEAIAQLQSEREARLAPPGFTTEAA